MRLTTAVQKCCLTKASLLSRATRIEWATRHVGNHLRYISLKQMELPEVVRTATIGGLIGAFITLLLTKFLAKTTHLRYSTRVERIASSADDPVLGNVRVTWADQTMRNLHLATIDVENPSSHDFEKIQLKVFTEQNTLLLNERTFVLNTPYMVSGPPDFTSRVAVTKGGTPTKE